MSSTSPTHIMVGRRRVRRFIHHPKPVNDGTVRCLACGQIDEPGYHDVALCPATSADVTDLHAVVPDPANAGAWQVRAPEGFLVFTTETCGPQTLKEAQKTAAISNGELARRYGEAPAEAEEIDLYDDKVQAGIAWTMRQWGEALGLKTWTQGDGSESVEGDVGAEIHTILVDAGLRDPETNQMAALRDDSQPVAGMRVHLVRSKAFGDLAIRHWASIGDLTEGEHVLYVSPASAVRDVVEVLKHYRCSCEPGHCAMSADDTDTPVDEQMCGRRASKALIALEGGAA